MITHSVIVFIKIIMIIMNLIRGGLVFLRVPLFSFFPRDSPCCSLLFPLLSAPALYSLLLLRFTLCFPLVCKRENGWLAAAKCESEPTVSPLFDRGETVG
jgi:hypothetical protein